MKSLNFSEKNFAYLKDLLQKDAEDIATDISFFEQLSLNPKEFIDERISLCHQFNLDFWEWINDNCSDYQSKQLKALYNGENMKEFIDNYKPLNQKELERNFLQMIVRNRNKEI